MEGVQKIGGIYKVKRRIPPECQSAFDGQEFVTRSLRTKDRKEAIQLATPILKEIDERIAAIRAGNARPLEATTEATTEAAFLPLDRGKAFDLIRNWRRATIQRASERA